MPSFNVLNKTLGIFGTTPRELLTPQINLPNRTKLYFEGIYAGELRKSISSLFTVLQSYSIVKELCETDPSYSNLESHYKKASEHIKKISNSMSTFLCDRDDLQFSNFTEYLNVDITKRNNRCVLNWIFNINNTTTDWKELSMFSFFGKDVLHETPLTVPQRYRDCVIHTFVTSNLYQILEAIELEPEIEIDLYEFLRLDECLTSILNDPKHTDLIKQSNHNLEPHILKLISK